MDLAKKEEKEMLSLAFKGIEKELFSEHAVMIRDYAKGAFRLRNEKKNLIKRHRKTCAQKTDGALVSSLSILL